MNGFKQVSHFFSANVSKTDDIFGIFCYFCRYGVFEIFMSKRTVIVLLSVIVLLAAIIAAGVAYLYTGVVVEESPVAEFKQEETQENVPVKQPETEVPVAEPVDTVMSSIKPVDIPSGPFKVRNCATGKDNLIRQNRDNSLELVDENGRSLWRIPFPGKLCGMVGQVDYYNNGKIQFLMAAGDKVHLIDRLGREVSGFPRQLPENAVVGPDKVTVRGTNYWRVDTEKKTYYLNLRKNEILTELPK